MGNEVAEANAVIQQFLDSMNANEPFIQRLKTLRSRITDPYG